MNIELLKKVVADWKTGKLSHAAAMLVVVQIVCPSVPTQKELDHVEHKKK